ncbi:MAG: PilZ domain-containing protein [Desulfomonilia bacterium]|nr:PilZ domain-containing protein [Desulfomonilia bacterium]
MDDPARVWITDQDALDLGILGTELPCRISKLKDLLYELLKDGSPKDLVVLPYFRNFSELVGHIRNRGITGPILIYTSGEIIQMNLLDYASQGVVFLDTSRLTKSMVLGFITFLQKQQSFSTKQEESPQPIFTTPKIALIQNQDVIRELFRSALKSRSKIMLTCQFREDLPTLTITCDIIQMVGEIETKLILDNFSPEESIALYNQLGGNAPISGYLNQEGQTLGFDLVVHSARRGKMTVFLPDSVYEQKRKYFRVEPDPKDPVTLYILPENHKTLGIRVKDISEGGAGVSSGYDGLEENCVYQVTLVLPRNQVYIGSATVVFKSATSGGITDYGLSFHFHPSDIQYLQHYVFKRQAGILAAVRNVSL